MELIELFFTFLKIGAFTFGGGYAMITMIQYEIEQHGWLSQAELVDFVAVSESTPGPLAVNMATFVGIKTYGIIGAVIATLGIVLPSFAIILIIAKFFAHFRDNKAVEGIMTSLKPAVVGMIGTAFLSIGRIVFFSKGIRLDCFTSISFWIFFCLFVIMVILAFKKIHPIIIILLSAVAGIATGYGLGL